MEEIELCYTFGFVFRYCTDPVNGGGHHVVHHLFPPPPPVDLSFVCSVGKYTPVAAFVKMLYVVLLLLVVY